MKHIYDMIVIGGGAAGYTAALYAARAGMDVLVLEKSVPGGQMVLTDQIDNYPGFDEGIDGYTLSMKMQKGAERFGAHTSYTDVLRVSLTGTEKTIETTDGDFIAHTVVLATGASPRKLGIPDEEKRIGQGIHYCAVCDGMFYKGKTVMVVGGGNTVVEDALHLSRIAERVILVHRRDSLRASKIYVDQLMRTENVSILWNSTVVDVLGDGPVRGVALRNTVNGDETVVPCDGVFVSIGRIPATDLFRGQISLDENGYVIADESAVTNAAGVFAAGDLRTKLLRQVITAAADGAVAACQAEEYLAKMRIR